MISGAAFSACRNYRYSLTREWNPERGRLLWIMLNPSTADESRDDATIKRCLVRGINGGFGSIEVVNLFALRSTDPRVLAQHDRPVGPDNDTVIAAACGRAAAICCAWGQFGSLMQRDSKVFHTVMITTGRWPFCLGKNSDGTPKHPLRVPYSVPFSDFQK